MRKHGGKACGEALAFLRHDGNFFSHHPRQIFNVRRRAHNGSFHVVECLCQSYCVVQKTAVQLRDRFERKFLGQRVFTEPGRGALAMITRVRFIEVMQSCHRFVRSSLNIANWDLTPA